MKHSTKNSYYCYYSKIKFSHLLVMINSSTRNVLASERDCIQLSDLSGHFFQMKKFKINKTFAWFKSQRQVRGDNRIKWYFEPNVCLRMRVRVLHTELVCLFHILFETTTNFLSFIAICHTDTTASIIYTLNF